MIKGWKKMNNIEINKRDYANELYKNIKNTNKYLEVSCIVPQINNVEELENNSPVAVVTIKNAGAIEKALAIISLEQQIEILKKDEYVTMALAFLKTMTKTSTISFDGEEK